MFQKSMLGFITVGCILFSACSKTNVEPAASDNDNNKLSNAIASLPAATVSKIFPVRSFSKLVLSSAGNVEITQGDSESVSVEADNDRLLSLVTVANSSDTLKISETPNAGSPGTFKTFVIRVTLKSVSYIQHIGSGSVGDISTTNTLHLPAFTFDWITDYKEKGMFSIVSPSMVASMSGGLVNNFSDGISTVYFYQSTITKVSLTRYGYGTFDGFYHTIGGRFGNASLDAEQLAVTNKATSMYAFGDAFVKASKKISLTNIGQGTLYYTGNATVVKKVNSGGGTITKF